MITSFSDNFQQSRRFLLLCGLSIITLMSCWALFCPYAHAGEMIIVAVTINTEKKTEVFAILEDDGDFLLRTADLPDLGIQQFDGRRAVVDGDEYVSLRSMSGVNFVFQEATLTLELEVEPKFLPVEIVDMLPVYKQEVVYTNEDSLFFNYGLDFEGGTATSDSFKRQTFSISNELGVRKEDILFYTDTFFIDTPEDSDFIRLNTNFTYDQRDEMRRFVVGDSRAFSGELGSRIHFAGLSLSKNYEIDPYFLETPFFNYSGSLSLPSEVTVFSDGVRLRSENLPPGRFDLQNLHNTGGAQEIVLEITDSLGRVQRIYTPFYFSDLLLREGLSEYSYNLGTIRRDYGTSDSRYSHAIFSAIHRYGLSDEFNLGFRSEASSELFNFGAESLYAFSKYGVIGLDLSASTDDDGSGWASFFRYEYRDRRFNVRFAWRNFSSGYQTLQRLEAENNRESDVRVGFGYVHRNLGSLALDLAHTSFQNSSDENLILLTYSKRLNRKLFLNSNLRYLDGEESSTELFVNLSYYFDNEHTLSTVVRQGSDSNSQAVEVRKDIPVGEGWAWWTLLGRDDDGSSDVYTLNPGGQINTSYGIYRGEIDLNSDNETVRLAASGSVVSVGGEYGFSRPVADSFALVKVNELKDVRVYTNGQEMGSTDEDGSIIIPDLNAFYHNRISIEDKDVEIDYLIRRIEKNISPPFRSGSCVSFPVERYQAFTGTLVRMFGDEARPLEYSQGELSDALRSIEFFTGGTGEFYFDNDSGIIEQDEDADISGCEEMRYPSSGLLSPGHYTGRAVSEIGEVCSFDIQLPQTDERYYDLGELVCEPVVEIEQGTTPDRADQISVSPHLENGIQPAPEKIEAEPPSSPTENTETDFVADEDEIELELEPSSENIEEGELVAPDNPETIIFSPKEVVESLAPDADQ